MLRIYASVYFSVLLLTMLGAAYQAGRLQERGHAAADYRATLALVIQRWHDDLVRLNAVDPSVPVSLDGTGIMGYYPPWDAERKAAAK